MNTKLFFNETDRKTFMDANGEDFICMPIDEKNITTDWIDDLFEYDEYVLRNGEWLGWIEGCPMRVTTSDNVATFHALDNAHTKNGGDPYNVATTIDAVLQDDNEDEENMWAIIMFDDSTGTTSVEFYFEETQFQK